MTDVNKIVHQACTEIKKLSSDLIENFTDDNIVGIIDKRAEYFTKLNNLTECLPEKKLKNLDHETRVLISEIVQFDNVIKDKILDRMNELSVEMQKLYKNSRATAAYISQKK